jgi:hypothetical protein
MSSIDLFVGLVIGISAACIVVFRSNRWGFLANSIIMLMGFLTIGIVAISVDNLSVFAFLSMTGIGVNLMFVPLEAGFFERLIAFLKLEGASASFPVQMTGMSIYLICLGTIGYTGGIAMFILSSTLKLEPLEFFKLVSIVACCIGTLCMTLSGIYLMIIKPRQLRMKRLIDETGDMIMDGFKETAEDANFKRKMEINSKK